MLTMKYTDINGNTYGLQIDFKNKTFKKSPYISISDLIGCTKTTRRHLKEIEIELTNSGYTETK